MHDQWYDEINILKGNFNFVFRRTSTRIPMLFFWQTLSLQKSPALPRAKNFATWLLLARTDDLPHNMQNTETEPDRRWRFIRPHLLVISASTQVE